MITIWNEGGLESSLVKVSFVNGSSVKLGKKLRLKVAGVKLQSMISESFDFTVWEMEEEEKK